MSNSQAFLDRLRAGRLPAYGSLRWDGIGGQVITAVNFEFHRAEPPEVVCERAYRFFAQLSPTEWRLLDIEVVTRDGKPVRAILKPLNNTIITTGRLRQLEAALSEQRDDAARKGQSP